jgi:hypothetical protein
VTSGGSPYARFRRALDTGNLTIIRAAAAELPRVELQDALAVCMAIRDGEPETFERAALRWIARLCTERRAASFADVRAAAEAFERLAAQPDDARATLARLCNAA